MEKIDKKAKILECIILEYIKTSTPIGSQHLQAIVDFDVSSATIRNYLKRMVEDGVLMQFHISGGRVPSIESLRDFWRIKIPAGKEIVAHDTQSVEAAAREYNIVSMIQMDESDKLIGVYAAGSKFVVAEFERGEVLLRANEHYENFLRECIGLEASQVRELAIRYRIDGLFQKMNEYIASQASKVVNKDELLEMGMSDTEWAKENMSLFLDGKIMGKIGRGIYFSTVVPNGYMAVKTDAKIGNENAQVLYAGHLSRNFGAFLCAI